MSYDHHKVEIKVIIKVQLYLLKKSYWLSMCATFTFFPPTVPVFENSIVIFVHNNNN